MYGVIFLLLLLVEIMTMVVSNVLAYSFCAKGEGVVFLIASCNDL
jgi:hypothetical protein